MRFEPPLIRGTLLRRYKRFLADVRLETGETVTAHCPNTGSMLGCAEPGMTVWLSRSDNPARKYPLTWEMVDVGDGRLVGIHTGRSNALVRAGIESGTVTELAGYETLRAEVKMGEGSRVDFVLDAHGRRSCVVEVKNVSAAVENRCAVFPDAVSVRARKHLQMLMACVESGQRAVLCYCVQREDVDEVRPAVDIDPDYARTLAQARSAGVEVMAWGARLDPAGIELTRRLRVGAAGRTTVAHSAAQAS